MRVGGDEQGVEVVAPVGWVVAPDNAGAAGRDIGDEAKLESVLARPEQLGGDEDMTVPGCAGWLRAAVG